MTFNSIGSMLDVDTQQGITGHLTHQLRIFVMSEKRDRHVLEPITWRRKACG